MIPRSLEQKLKEMAAKFPVVTLSGPRQSGKTTLVRSAFPGYEYVSLEDPDILALAKDDPISFLDRYRSEVIFDEAQRFPDLFSYAQRRIDECGKAGQYIITGSQDFLLMKAVSQSLAGRAAVLELPPFSHAELSAAGRGPESSDDWVVRGGYPRIYDRGIDPGDYYPSYVRTYLERDVRRELGVVKLAEFERFLALCALRSGEILNVAGLARDCGITEKTAREWLSALEASHIVHLVQPYFSNQGKRLIKTPKLYFWDTGLACSLIGIDGPGDLLRSERRGALFETAVVAEAAKHCLARGRRPNLCFWRDTNGNEVDLVVMKGVRPLRAFEVKSSKTYNGRYFDAVERISTGELGLGPGEFSVVYGGTSPVETARGRMLPIGMVSAELSAAGLL